jgi:putative FmdB family regulatory protein
MPVYTYRCENCGVQFERTQKFTDAQLTRCPECGKKSLRKVYTPVGIVFKGSGWYATDNRSPSGVNWSNKTSETKTNSEEKSKNEKSTSPAVEPAKPAQDKSSSSEEKK